MKKLTKLFSLCLALVLVLTCIPAAFAAEADDCMINEDAKASLTIWKFDWTNAYKDGVWNEDSFISTGWRESYVEEVLGETVRYGDANGEIDNPLGNGQNSNGYALKGVEFTILRVADIVTFSESANDQHPDYNLTMVLYGFHKEKAADLLTAIGLPDGEGRYENADNMVERDHELVELSEVEGQSVESEYWYYQSDVLNKALADALEANATTVKDALEAYIAASDEAIVMDKTNENGKTIKRDLDLGLWLCVETAVPEMVTSTTNPFFVSLPMTTVSGDANSASPEGGHFWNYDVVVYPKNNTGIPSLEKTVRESVKDTGKNDGSDNIHVGFAHNATGSAGDVLEYQIITNIPTISSNATSLKTWNFYDSISEGISYNKSLKDVKIEIFTDEDCTDKVATWLQDDGRFTVTYSSDDRHMTIDVTEAGLDEINGNAENVNGKLFSSYSNYTMRITYTATINSDASFIYGENGNCNEVVLTWKRTSSEYYDTLIDDCHVFSFGMDLTKLFSDLDSESATEMDMFKHVKFKVWNESDGYWLTATRDEETGIYYVTGHVTEEADATIFYPVTVNGEFGKVVIKGMEDDCWNIYEVETANGYTLLKDEVYVDIFVEENYDRIYNAYTGDGGLHGLDRKDFDNYHTYSEAKKEVENGQFFTPPKLCEYIVSSLRNSGNGILLCTQQSLPSSVNFEFVNKVLIPMTAVRPVEDRAYALQDFKKWMKTNKYGNCDSKRFILKSKVPELYFKDQYLEFLRAAIKLVVLPKEDFIRDNGNLQNLMYDLQSSYERVLNTYIMVDDETPVTMDAFIRAAQLDTPYYFGCVFECRFG